MNTAHHFTIYKRLLILACAFAFLFFFDMHTAAAAATLSQEQYIFINDNGTTTDKYTQSHSDATNTPITNVKKGEKLIPRIQIANTGTTAATSTYRLQYENNTDTPGTWSDLGTTTQIRWELSQNAGRRSPYGQVPLPTKQVGTCTTTTTYVEGLFAAGTATTTAYSLNPNKCTEFAFAIETSGATLNKTYRLRLVSGSTTSALNTYPQYPTFTIESGQTIRYSKEARGGYSTTTIDNGLVSGIRAVGDNSSMAIGTDGFPVIAYWDVNALKLLFAKCNDSVCGSYATSSLDSNVGSAYDDRISLNIGRDGNPVVGYYSSTIGQLKIAKCNNLACTSPTLIVMATGQVDGRGVSMAIGSDGFPIAIHKQLTTGFPVFTHCNDASCGTVTTTQIDRTISNGVTSITIGSDGLPVATYGDTIGNVDLLIAKCSNFSCSSMANIATSTVLAAAGASGYIRNSITIGDDGFPIIISDDDFGTKLIAVHCLNLSCTSTTTSVIDSGSLAGGGGFIAVNIGADGFPMISYDDSSSASNFDHHKYAKCGDVACTASLVSTTTLDIKGNRLAQGLSASSITLGTNGFPFISYFGSTTNSLMFISCNNENCSPNASSSANLTSTNNDLGSYLDDAAYTNIAASDNIYDSISAGTSTRLAYLFTRAGSDNTIPIAVTWEGQLSKATTTYLKIYNNSTGAWEVLTSTTSPAANTDFTLTGTASTSISSYYDGSNVAYFRLETGTTTGTTTLKTDFVNIITSVPTIAQTAYIFLNDNGTTTDGYTQAHSAATNTPITNVKKGEKLVARIQIDNIGSTASNNNQYRLQWENNTDAAGTWSDLGTTTQIQWALSQNGALPGIYGEVPLTSRQVGTCTTTTTFSPGFFVAGTATSTSLSLGSNTCTELAYAIETRGATLGKTYRLRLVMGSTTIPLDVYTRYPAFTMESTQNIRYSKEVHGGYSTTTLDSLGSLGDAISMVIGVDGFPVIAYHDITNTNLNFAKCRDTSCASYSTSTLDSGGVDDDTPRIAIGSDGFPVITYYNGANEMNFAKCNNVYCTSVSTSTITACGCAAANSGGIVIGTDGFPVIEYYGNAYGVRVIKCNNLACSSRVDSDVDPGTGSMGWYVSMAIGSDGFPVISYQDGDAAKQDLRFAKCNNASCSSAATSTLDSAGDRGEHTAIAIGSDGYPVIVYNDENGAKVDLVKCTDIFCSGNDTNPTGYSTSTLVAGNPDYGASIVIGTDGYPVIAYRNNSPGPLKFIKCNNVACSSSTVSSLDTSGDTGQHVSMAIGTDGYPAIAYQDVTKSDIIFAKCNNIACAPATSATGTLTSTNADLANYLDDAGYTNVAVSDNIYDSISAGTSTRLAYLFTKKNKNNIDAITATWEGQVSVATTTYLKIYNNSTAAWEVLASNAAPVANTDFTLSATEGSNVANYYDSSNVAYIRVETGTTTASTTFKTDYVNISGNTLAQTAYIFLNDDGITQGTTTDTYTKAHSAATSTAITNVKKGEKLVTRIQIDNTGTGTSSLQYRLQWENNTDAPNTWSDLSTTTQIQWSLSQKAAFPSRYGEVPITTRQVGTCTTTTTFSSGLFVGGTATSSMFSLGPNKCTELAYTIETSGATLGKTYRLRLVTGSTTNTLDAYTQYPTFTMESAQNIRYSKEVRGGYATSTAETSGDDGVNVSMAIGTDGFPVFAFFSNGFNYLDVTKCNDVACASVSTTQLDTGGRVGLYTSIAIGSDGLPVISYYDQDKLILDVAHCNDISCTSAATTSLTGVGSGNGQYTSIAIGQDGYPVISFYNATSGVQDLNFAKCKNIFCTSASTSTLDTTGDVGNTSSIAIGSDGYPVISYGDHTKNRLDVVKCADISCTVSATSTLDVVGVATKQNSIAIGSDGYPMIAYYGGVGSLMFAKCNNISCSSASTSTVDSVYDRGQRPVLAVGTDGLPLITYFYTTNGALLLARCNNMSCTSAATSTIEDQPAGSGDYSTIAIGYDGNPVIAYHDSTTFDLNVAICSNPACTTAASSTANLPQNTADLDMYLDDAGYTNVANSDNLYDSVVAGTSTRLAFLFTKKNTDNTDTITATWEGNVSKATTTYLKIYNNSSGAWEVLTSNSAPVANTDFVLSGTKSANLSNYYDASNVVYVRVETGTTTASTSLKTDQVSIGLSTLAQTAYIFLNDNGTSTEQYTQAHGAATSTAIAGVKKGEKLITRIQIDNTGTATSTNQYRLQWENNTDAPGTWTDLGTTTQVQWALSQKGAIRGNYGGVPLTTRQVGTCTTTATYSAGLFVGGTATSTMLGLGPNKCTELAYAIETSGATVGKTYRLRLVTGSTTNTLTAYTQYPTFSMESTQNIRYSKEARGGIATSTLDSPSLGSLSDYTALAIGVDGFPVIAYRAQSPGSLKFVKCNDAACSSSVASKLDGGNGGTTEPGSYPSMAIGRDGFPVIVYYDLAVLSAYHGSFELLKCNDIACTSFATSTIDVGVGYATGVTAAMSSIAIGTDGYPVITYYNGTTTPSVRQDLMLAKCNNVACTSVSTSTLDSGGDVGWSNFVTIGADGFPVIAYYDQTNTNLDFVKCGNVSCTSYATSSIDTANDYGQYISMAIGSDGFPIISHNNNTTDDLRLTKCNDISCTSVTSTSPDIGGSVGHFTSLTIGTDGFPVIAYNRNVVGDVDFLKCNNVACSSYATATIDTFGLVGDQNAIAIGADGYPVITTWDQTSTGALRFIKCGSISCFDATSTTLANLPNTNADLSNYLDDAGYTNVAASDNIYDSVYAATGTRAAYLFARKNANDTDPIMATWEGQVSLATTTYLKIYNSSSSAWEVLASNAAPVANTDFTLSGTQSSNTVQYYDANNFVYLRVETGTTTASTSLKTDQISMMPTLAQTAYIFLNDDGTSTDQYTKAHSAATNTPITNVKKGEKLIARIQIDNTGAASSTNQYRLQWENNTDAAGTWSDLGTSTQIRFGLSQKGAIPGRLNDPLATNQVGTCTTTTTYSPGFFVAGVATSSMLSVGPSKCTELAYAIETSGATLSKTYRLRLVTGSTTNTLGAYTRYPTFTMESAQNIRYSREVRGGYATTTLDALGTILEIDRIAIGVDGFPVIMYFNNTAGTLNIAKCRDTSCASYATSTIDSQTIGFGGSIAIGSDGFPVIAYDTTASAMRFAKCNNVDCTSFSTSTILGCACVSIGNDMPMVIGADGFPVIAYDRTGIYVLKCNDINCTSRTNSYVYPGGSVWYYSMAIGIDGYPVISAYDSTPLDLVFAKCNSASCSSAATSTLTSEGDVGQQTSIAIGSDGYPVIAYGSNAKSELDFVKCNNISCAPNGVSSPTGYSTSTIDTNNAYGNSLAIGTDGFPVIAYYPGSGTLKVAKCYNLSCSSRTLTTLDSSGDTGKEPTMSIGTDGFPVIAYQDNVKFLLNVAKCNNTACAPATSATGTITTTNADLDQYLDDVAYTNVANSDNVYDSISAGTSTRLAYLFTRKNGNNTDPITPVWEGQVSVATTTYLKIYNNTTAAWEVLGSNTAPAANTDFVLTGTASTSITSYYDSNNVTYIRVETGTTTASTTLKTDQISITLPTIAQSAYIFLNDDGTTTDKYTQAHSAATNTPITSVKKGEKLIARIQIDNTGTATSTTQYRLQWENQTDNQGVWNDLASTTQIRWELSQQAGRRSPYGQVPLPTNQVGTCTTTTTYSAGLFTGGGATTTAYSLAPNKCTEFAFAIETSGATLAKTYRLRLVTGSTTIPLSTYTQYPTLTIESGQTIRYSKEARGGYSTTTIDNGSVSGTPRAVGEMSSMAIGIDGFPVIAYWDINALKLLFAKCNDPVCGSYATSTIDTSVGNTAWQGDISLNIGRDGNPVIGYYKNTGSFNIAKCNNLACSSPTLIVVVSGNNDGMYLNMAIGSDGFPVALYRQHNTGYAVITHCNDASCGTVTTTTVNGDIGTNVTSISIGADGYPVGVYMNAVAPLGLRVAKCNNFSCSSMSTSTVIAGAGGNGLTRTNMTIGDDGFPIIAVRDDFGNKFIAVHCRNLACTSTTTSIIDNGVNVGFGPSVTIGTDGFPVIAYVDHTAGFDQHKYAKCGDIICTASLISTTTLDSKGNGYSIHSIAIGANGFPVISYMASTTNSLNFISCNNEYCSPNASSSANLTASSSDLAIPLDDAAYTNVAFSDNVYDSITAGTSTRLAYLFARKNGNNTDTITATWEGQISKATTTYLKIYNVNSGAWEVLTSNAAPAANVDFTLTGTQSSNLSNYYDGSNIVYMRIETGTTTGTTTLKTDQISLSVNIVQNHYRWRADNGSETGAAYIAPEDIPLAATSSMYKGDRMRLRMLLNNTGGSTATNFTYRLEVASSSCANTYYTVPTSATLANEEWVMDLSQYILDGAPTTNSSSLTDPAGQTFTPGEIRVQSNTTGPTALTSAQFSEYEYSIRSTSRATAALLYCFRVSNAGVTTNFTYTAQPQVTLNSSLRPQAGGANSEASGNGAVHNSNGEGGGSNSEGSGSGGTQSGGGAGGGGGDSG